MSPLRFYNETEAFGFVKMHLSLPNHHPAVSNVLSAANEAIGVVGRTECLSSVHDFQTSELKKLNIRMKITCSRMVLLERAVLAIGGRDSVTTFSMYFNETFQERAPTVESVNIAIAFGPGSCSEDSCPPFSKCEEMPLSYTCNFCDPLPCVRNGLCLSLPIGPQCDCPFPYAGRLCLQSRCSCVHGTCHVVHGKCDCDDGWKGINCDVKSENVGLIVGAVLGTVGAVAIGLCWWRNRKNVAKRVTSAVQVVKHHPPKVSTMLSTPNDQPKTMLDEEDETGTGEEEEWRGVGAS
eukprot:c3763_g1_i1.p1 GENE.c3763_g1_i1~~c3763_g1_i1.p1  ORF type:complete len:294 (+),score=76.68 c3763_g1_i1:783-1664(+)